MPPKIITEVLPAPNKALQLTADPLRGLPVAELGRYVQNEPRTYL